MTYVGIPHYAYARLEFAPSHLAHLVRSRTAYFAIRSCEARVEREYHLADNVGRIREWWIVATAAAGTNAHVQCPSMRMILVDGVGTEIVCYRTVDYWQTRGRIVETSRL